MKWLTKKKAPKFPSLQVWLWIPVCSLWLSNILITILTTSSHFSSQGGSTSPPSFVQMPGESLQIKKRHSTVSISPLTGPWYTVLTGVILLHAGSHMLPSYYSMRRPFISDSDFCSSTKQFSPDVYSSTLGGKPLGCEPSTMTSYSSLIDSYYPETFGDYRSTAAFSTSGGSFLPSSALSSLLPSYAGEASQLFLVGWAPSFKNTH